MFTKCYTKPSTLQTTKLNTLTAYTLLQFVINTTEGVQGGFMSRTTSNIHIKYYEIV
jgi:hypothetical protein